MPLKRTRGRRSRRKGSSKAGTLSGAEAAGLRASNVLLAAEAQQTSAWLGRASASVDSELAALKRTVLAAGKTPSDQDSFSDLFMRGRGLGGGQGGLGEDAR